MEGLDIDHIATYVRPKTDMQNDWEERPAGHQGHLRASGHPAGGAQVACRCGRAVRLRAGLSQRYAPRSPQQGVVYTDMESALKGEYADMVRKYFMKLVTPARPQVRGAARRGVVGRLVRVCAEGRAGLHPAAVLFPPQRQGRGSVRAYAHHRRRGREPALHRGLLRPEVQRREPPRRLRRALCQEEREAALFHHRELVEEYVQPQHQARACRGRRR